MGSIVQPRLRDQNAQTASILPLALRRGFPLTAPSMLKVLQSSETLSEGFIFLYFVWYRFLRFLQAHRLLLRK